MQVYLCNNDWDWDEGYGGSNPIHISATSWGDDTSAEVRLFDHLDGFKRLKTLSDDVSICNVKVGWGGSVVLGSSVHLSECTNTGVSAHVQMTGEGCTSDVIPK